MPTAKRSRLPGIGDDTNIVGIVKKDGKPTGEIEEITAALAFAEKLPPLDDKVLLKATWDAAELAHRVGVTTFADLSFGTIPGGYQAYQTAAADPDFPVRTVLNPVIQVFQKPEIVAKGGLDALTEWHKADSDRLSFGGVKFVVDGSIQGYTGAVPVALLLQDVRQRGRQHLARRSHQMGRRGAQARVPSRDPHQRQRSHRNGAHSADRSPAAISATGDPGPAGA